MVNEYQQKYKAKIHEEIYRRYFECIGDKKLMNQFRKEHPRYYLRAKRFWHGKENIKMLQKAQSWKYAEKGRERTRERVRLHRLSSTSGKAIYGLNKRPYTNYCEICGKLKPMNLKYHHWNKDNPSMGIWVCYSCHHFAEACDKGYTATYQQKKQQIESCLLKKRALKNRRKPTKTKH